MSSTRLVHQPFARSTAALSVVVVALGGMAYCHVKDLPDKLEEDIVYMAALFVGNIALSLALIAVFLVAYASRSERLIRNAWAAAVVLAALTIVGFVASRTVGLPQMDDHVGEWDSLGLASLVFEGTIVALGTGVLLGSRRHVVARAAYTTTLVVGAMAVLAATASADDMGDEGGSGAMPGMVVRGDMRPYPSLRAAMPDELAAGRALARSTKRGARQFRTLAAARKRGYKIKLSELADKGFPAVYHARKGGAGFTGRVLDAAAPQALMYYCTAFGRCSLIGFMYRAPGDSEPPTYGPVLAWHRHAKRNTSGTWMTHVWLTRTVGSAFARCVPWSYLTAVVKPTIPRAPASAFLQDCPADAEA